jgi:hypothetical protein
MKHFDPAKRDNNASCCVLYVSFAETVPLKLMPGERLELSWPCDRQLLKLVRLPFRHPGISLYGMHRLLSAIWAFVFAGCVVFLRFNLFQPRLDLRTE